MLPVIFIAAFAAAAYGVTRRLGRSGDITATYSSAERDAIRRALVREKKSPPA
ncbi:hypothetical protein [Nocardioides marmoribigeumensis]|jgi:hypothetical protein|uniref:Uncharacterized protein n=1 Tax=Nocardioides marmoribigeumensis TaxID=433649 RepID=A0ABU2BSE4_9ACTN|nr:hypothetical protein [Nocardioides marmoribigeumensis]MDR7361548.1 hypothetical protein [Nocardioides marmoribigeumensis]